MLLFAAGTSWLVLGMKKPSIDAGFGPRLLVDPVSELEAREDVAISEGGADLVISHGKQRFAVECRASGQMASVILAARRARKYAEARKQIPLVVVPFMGEVGQRLCEEEGVSWFDLSGNAHLVTPGLRIQIEGKPNQFKQAGRPKSLFAPKSARIVRWLLMKNDQAFTQRELARLCGLDEGFTSRVVRGLEDQQLIARSAGGAVSVTDCGTLLDAWREVYDFSKNTIVRGHVPARSSDDVLRQLAEKLKQDKMEYAATGLAGAWLQSGFAGFRLVTLYVAELPSDAQRQRLGFHEIERGENVWLVQPADSGVFQGVEFRESIACVHPVQVYLDLKNQPERSVEAAQELRKTLLKSPSPS